MGVDTYVADGRLRGGGLGSVAEQLYTSGFALAEMLPHEAVAARKANPWGTLADEGVKPRYYKAMEEAVQRVTGYVCPDQWAAEQRSSIVSVSSRFISTTIPIMCCKHRGQTEALLTLCSVYHGLTAVFRR